MIFYIRYRHEDGEILGWGSGCEPDPVEGLAVAYGKPFVPDPTMQKYDIDTGSIIEKTPDEQRTALLPALFEVQAEIFGELTRTVEFMLSDYPTDEQDGWRDYRKTLRHLSRDTNPVEMINAWPVAPDGSDPISILRMRL